MEDFGVFYGMNDSEIHRSCVHQTASDHPQTFYLTHLHHKEKMACANEKSAMKNKNTSNIQHYEHLKSTEYQRIKDRFWTS